VDEYRLQVFEMAVLTNFNGVSLRDRYRNDEVRAAFEIELNSVEIIHCRELFYFGHFSRMKPVRLPISYQYHVRTLT